MGTAELIAFIITNAPAALEAADDIFEWGKKTYAQVTAAYEKPAAELTKEEVTAVLDQIAAKSDEIQSLA